MIIHMKERCGSFAEDKDIARDLREKVIKTMLIKSDEFIVLDFSGVESSTQSFIHALISEVFQKKGESALDRFEFRHCSDVIKSIITTVINYSLE